MRFHPLLLVAPFAVLLSTPLARAQTQGETKASRPYLGVLVTRTEDGGHGALVREVTPDSPAAKAGLRPGDRIVKIGGQDVTDVEKFLQAVEAHKPGDKLTLRVVRDGKEQEVAPVLGERPRAGESPPAGLPELPGARRPAFLGVQTQALTPDLRKHLKVETESGVVVTEVVPNSPAAHAGLQADDVITGINDRPVKDPAELREAVQQAGPGKEVTLQILRGSEKRSVKATLREGRVGFFLTPGEDRFPMLDVESMMAQSRRLRELERRVDELEKRLHALEKKSGQSAR